MAKAVENRISEPSTKDVHSDGNDVGIHIGRVLLGEEAHIQLGSLLISIGNSKYNDLSQAVVSLFRITES
jgi:hypothetical protein